MAIELSDVRLTSGEGAFGAVLAVPDGAGPWPALVVVHEIFGVDDAMRAHLRRLAGMGYLALMPDLYWRGGARRCLVATVRALRSGTGPAFSDIEAARTALLDRPDCTGAVGVIGFCLGGGFALLAASRGFEAASVNYGMLPDDLDAALEGACPIVASYGGADRALPGAAAKLETALEARGIRHDVTEYAGANHAFLNDRPAGWWWARPFLRIRGMGPDPDAAAQAWTRIDAFLRRELTHSPGS